MNQHHEEYRSTRCATRSPARWTVVALLVVMALTRAGGAQQATVPGAAANNSLSAEQVVERLVQMNFQRAQALRTYHGTRLYRAKYHGFGGDRAAEMVVSVKYTSPATKDFTVETTTGSKVIIDKVFKKALESETEALGEDNQQQVALNNDNYAFTLLRVESDGTGRRYVLAVEPKTKSKFLYRGTIWVDAEDFAVVRIEAQPAKNPSFWTKNVQINQKYEKVGDFWLPAQNHSLSAIRLGGHADFTIDYKDYRITDADRVGSSSPEQRPATSVSEYRLQR